MAAYYNEIEPYCVAWLRNLIAAGHIAPGDVDDRPIQEVRPNDLRGYTQAHFFAGIGGWSLAARLAGLADSERIWTGSCPCQPFSRAGKRRGFDDDRHLWPVWRSLIEECRPPAILGEQVAGAPDWLRLVRGDLEALGYAVGCLPIEAASAGAEHFRDRYWFVADRDGAGGIAREQAAATLGHGHTVDAAGRDGDWPLPDCKGQRLQVALGESSDPGAEQPATARDRVRPLVKDPSHGWGEGWTESDFRSRGFAAAVASIEGRQYLECSDGKWRRLPPPRVRWLGNGIPARVARLRAFGNAIDPRPAAHWIAAWMETRP